MNRLFPLLIAMKKYLNMKKILNLWVLIFAYYTGIIKSDPFIKKEKKFAN